MAAPALAHAPVLAQGVIRTQPHMSLAALVIICARCGATRFRSWLLRERLLVRLRCEPALQRAPRVPDVPQLLYSTCKSIHCEASLSRVCADVCSRADYLKRTLASVYENMGEYKPAVYISQVSTGRTERFSRVFMCA